MERPITLTDSVSLGDLLRISSLRQMHIVRGVVELPRTVGYVGGFVVAGELDALLSVPTRPTDPIGFYTPAPRMPVPAQHTRSLVEGVFNYWAPHLPAIQGAMGELAFRVIEARGSVDPVIVLYRGEEPVVFVRTAYVAPGEIRFDCLERRDTTGAVIRHAATVAPPALESSNLYERMTSR